ncbi:MULTISPECIES: YoaK family protein [unclassified Paraburkholderia]|uniref:YoaK family protein n=1 Tax=unclassified Paraburkholderia TaxID=2615204 RepID=UPI002AB1FC4C|nr:MULTISPECIES: YoaK family protein [unclassified Paraburkholderia]
MQQRALNPAAVLAPLRGENVVLAFVAGYVDTLGFVALFGLFTAHVTGNFILIGSGLAGAGSGLLIKWLAFPAFIAGIVAARVLDNHLRERSHGMRVSGLYALQIALLAAFMIAGLLAAPITHADAPLTIVCGLLGAAGMGVQNAHARLTARSVVANTVMTGNVTQAVIDVFDLLVPGHARVDRSETRERLARTLPPVLAFALGAGGGALGWLSASFWALALPLALLAMLAVSAWQSAQAEAAA